MPRSFSPKKPSSKLVSVCRDHCDLACKPVPVPTEIFCRRLLLATLVTVSLLILLLFCVLPPLLLKKRKICFASCFAELRDCVDIAVQALSVPLVNRYDLRPRPAFVGVGANLHVRKHIASAGNAERRDVFARNLWTLKEVHDFGCVCLLCVCVFINMSVFGLFCVLPPFQIKKRKICFASCFAELRDCVDTAVRALSVPLVSKCSVVSPRSSYSEVQAVCPDHKVSPFDSVVLMFLFSVYVAASLVLLVSECSVVSPRASYGYIHISKKYECNCYIYIFSEVQAGCPDHKDSSLGSAVVMYPCVCVYDFDCVCLRICVCCALLRALSLLSNYDSLPSFPLVSQDGAVTSRSMTTTTLKEESDKA
jgi:hypothetical protein